MSKQRFTKCINLVLVVMVMTAFVCILSACNNSSANDETTEESTEFVPSDTPTDTPSPTPTLTPTPTLSPTPTPSPTPAPEYVPRYDSFEADRWYNTVSGPFVDARSIVAQVVDNPDDITVLVNKYYCIPSDYVPSDLVPASHSGGQEIRSEVNEQWCRMYDACYEATGQGLYMVSGYRTWNIQEYLFYRSTNLRGIEFSVRKNAVPGRSEHQLGLAIDITPAGEYEILDEFGETRTGMWVNEHCYEYGFVRRFQYEYRFETGYDQEAWHYRYVGVELATYLYENNMSLEAYYGLTQVIPYLDE